MLRRITWLTGAAIFSVTAIWAVSALRATGDVGAGNKAVDPVGAWKLKCMPPDGKPRECVVTISRAESGLQGEYAADGRTRPVRKVAFDEGILSLEVDGQFAGQSYGLIYKGIPRGDALHGTVRWSFGWATGSFAFQGERIEQEVASAR